MGLYNERVLPRITYIACGAKALDPLRLRVCHGLIGGVVGRDRIRVRTQRALLSLVDHPRRGDRTCPAWLAAGRPTPSGGTGPGEVVGTGRGAPAVPRRHVRCRPVHLDAAYDSRRRSGARGTATSAQTRRDLPFPGARNGPGRETVRRWQTPHRAGPEAGCSAAADSPGRSPSWSPTPVSSSPRLGRTYGTLQLTTQRS